MLRELHEKDVEGMLEWMHDEEIQKAFRYPMGLKSRQDVLEFIQTAKYEIKDGNNFHYAITNELDEYLGTISLKHLDLSAKNAEYAISLRKMAHGKGIATIATIEILKKAFEEFGLERVFLNVLSDNEAAIRLYEKCGFIYEGMFRRHIFVRGEYKTLKWYSMLKEEYIEKHGKR